LPRLDALVVTTAGTLRTQRILDLVWETLVPALDGAIDPPSRDANPAFPATPTGAPGSPRSGELVGVTFAFSEPFALPTRLYGGQAQVVSARLERSDDVVALALTDRMGTYRLPVGVNAWLGGTSPLSTGYAEPYKGLARWEAPNRLAIELVFTEGGFRPRSTAAHAEDAGQSGPRRARHHRQAVSVTRVSRDGRSRPRCP
jgi:hypothetical protein